jgi:hypothetical protein
MYKANSSSLMMETLSTAYRRTLSLAKGASRRGSASSGGRGLHRFSITYASRTYSGSSQSMAIRKIWSAYGRLL